MKSSLAWGSAVVLAICVVGCGASSPTAESPASGGDGAESSSAPAEGAATEEEAQEPPSDSEESEGKMAIPSSCYDGQEPCLPDPKWVKRLCQDVYPAVALVLFQKSSPFSRGYLTRKTKAVNASGGATSGAEWLAFDEEVVLLHHRGADAGGMQVSGAMGGYDALRLDGSCVTLGSDEVRMQEPPRAEHTKVPWRYIGDDMEDALLDHEAIKQAYIARRKECRGAFSGTVTQKCVQLDEKLNRVIISALEEGETDLPQPEKRP